MPIPIGAACRAGNSYRVGRGLPAANVADVERHATTVLSIRDALERLPSRAREALRLRFDNGKTYAEIAAELGISEYAVERFVAKVWTRLRGLLRGQGTP
jgi:RNA polymerase sigma factor (sigma-70 family)